MRQTNQLYFSRKIPRNIFDDTNEQSWSYGIPEALDLMFPKVNLLISASGKYCNAKGETIFFPMKGKLKSSHKIIQFSILEENKYHFDFQSMINIISIFFH